MFLQQGKKKKKQNVPKSCGGANDKKSPFCGGAVRRKSNSPCSHGDWAFFFPFLLLKWRARKRRETAPKAVAANSFFVPGLTLTCRRSDASPSVERAGGI